MSSVVSGDTVYYIYVHNVLYILYVYTYLIKYMKSYLVIKLRMAKYDMIYNVISQEFATLLLSVWLPGSCRTAFSCGSPSEDQMNKERRHISTEADVRASGHTNSLPAKSWLMLSAVSGFIRIYLETLQSLTECTSATNDSQHDAKVMPRDINYGVCTHIRFQDSWRSTNSNEKLLLRMIAGCESDYEQCSILGRDQKSETGRYIKCHRPCRSGGHESATGPTGRWQGRGFTCMCTAHEDTHVAILSWNANGYTQMHQRSSFMKSLGDWSTSMQAWALKSEDSPIAGRAVQPGPPQKYAKLIFLLNFGRPWPPVLFTLNLMWSVCIEAIAINTMKHNSVRTMCWTFVLELVPGH